VDDGEVKPPELDAGRIQRLRAAFSSTGGTLSLEADRVHAESMMERWKNFRRQADDSVDFHRRAALWAVTGGTPDFPVPEAAGVIYANAGYPGSEGPDPVTGEPRFAGFHGPALAARPGTRHAYSEADPDAARYNGGLLAARAPLRVSAFKADAAEPGAVLGHPFAMAVLDRGPVMVQLQLCAHWWPGSLAAAVLGEYAEQLRKRCPGSTLALSVGSPGSGADAGEILAALREGTGATAYAHTEDDIATWLDDAGLQVTPAGVTDVRSREHRWAAQEFARLRTVPRVIEAVALVRP
jgi:hypothetical protein